MKASKRKLVLGFNSDAKTSKGVEADQVLTGILYLSPSDLSGYQVCPMAKLAGCEKPCLNSAGRGAFNSVQIARLNKTKRFFEDRDAFMLDLEYSINALIRKANRENLQPMVRLNGTSDIKWENIAFTNSQGVAYNNIFEAFPNVQFYDYTKIPNRKNIPENYDLTFSYSGVSTFAKYNQKALLNDNLNRIAVVFDKRETMPIEFMGRKVLDGDNSDVRAYDPKNVIIGLYAKGNARKDKSGFVVKTN